MEENSGNGSRAFEQVLEGVIGMRERGVEIPEPEISRMTLDLLILINKRLDKQDAKIENLQKDAFRDYPVTIGSIFLAVVSTISVFVSNEDSRMALLTSLGIDATGKLGESPTGFLVVLFSIALISFFREWAKKSNADKEAN